VFLPDLRGAIDQTVEERYPETQNGFWLDAQAVALVARFHLAAPTPLSPVAAVWSL
jgi:hypothetical protein